MEMGSIRPSGSTSEQKEEHQASVVQHVEQTPLPNPGLRQRQGDAEAALVNSNVPANERLDQYLERHHITGIAFAGTIGIGILVNSGRILGLAGGLGAILSYLIAGGVVSSVMVCLAEMISVRPVIGAIFDFPKLYVDPALGFAVGIVYWIAYTTSCITLMVSGALLAGGGNNVAAWLVAPIVTITLSNSFGGIWWYANTEWCFKWLKIIFLGGLDITMIVLNIKGTASNGPIGVNILSRGLFPTGFYLNGSNSNGTSVTPEIGGATGIFLSVWTGIQLALFAFIGVEIVVVTAGEAKYKKRDLPRASRRLYIWTVGFYVISIFLISLNVSYDDPELLSYDDTGVRSSFSPFVIALNHANLAQSSTLASAATVGLVLAAWTTANTALYVASRTLHALFARSTTPRLRQTIGSTSSGGTPLWAILVTICPALLSFIAQVPGDGLVALDTFGQIAITCVLCVYIAECLSFIRFKSIANSGSLNRKSTNYRTTYYRGPRQPFWAYFGLVFCSLLLLFSGWPIFYRINQGPTMSASDIVAGLFASYGGLVLFVGIIVFYKFRYGLPRVVSASVSKRFPTVADDPPYPVLRQPHNTVLKWIVRVLRAMR